MLDFWARQPQLWKWSRRCCTYALCSHLGVCLHSPHISSRTGRGALDKHMLFVVIHIYGSPTGTLPPLVDYCNLQHVPENFQSMSKNEVSVTSGLWKDHSFGYGNNTSFCQIGHEIVSQQLWLRWDQWWQCGLQETSWLSWLFEKVVMVMVVYFVISIIHSMAQSYHKQLTQPKSPRTSPSKTSKPDQDNWELHRCLNVVACK